jgi:hypothetical protein
MTDATCICTAELCDHPSGKRCGKAVTVKVKTAVALGGSKFSPENETGICEDCWSKIRLNLPWLFSP